MKKLFHLIMTVVMAVSLSSFAFAGTDTTTKKTSEGKQDPKKGKKVEPKTETTKKKAA
jgi:hypothetical protein